MYVFEGEGCVREVWGMCWEGVRDELGRCEGCVDEV